MKRSELYKIRAMIEKAAVFLADDDAIEAQTIVDPVELSVTYLKKGGSAE